MTIARLLEDLDNLTEEDRDTYTTKLLAVLSDVSKQTLLEFQENWDMLKTYEEFVTRQNKVLRLCVAAEVGSIGTTVRKLLGLAPLTLETIL